MSDLSLTLLFFISPLILMLALIDDNDDDNTPDKGMMIPALENS